MVLFSTGTWPCQEIATQDTRISKIKTCMVFEDSAGFSNSARFSNTATSPMFQAAIFFRYAFPEPAPIFVASARIFRESAPITSFHLTSPRIRGIISIGGCTSAERFTFLSIFIVSHGIGITEQHHGAYRSNGEGKKRYVMTSEKTSADKADALRRLAEERLKERERRNGPRPGEDGVPAETRRLIQELQIYQIELEIQNEELLKSRAEVEAGLELFTNLFDFAPVGYFTLDREGAILRTNLAGASLLGQERSRLANRRFSQFVSEPDRPEFNRFLKNVFTKQDTLHGKEFCEVALSRQQDPASLLESTSSRHAAAVNRHYVHVEGAVSEDRQECRVVMTDVTERKRTQERFREVLENSQDVSYKRNLQTDDFDYLSPVFAKISGYAMGEIKSWPMETFMDYVHPDDLAEIGRVIAESASSAIGTAHQMTYRFKRKDGQYRWCNDQFTIMRDANGQPLAIIGSVSDITERKRAEDALRNSEQKYRELSIVDDLTQLYNSRHFYHQFKMEIDRVARYGQLLTLMLLDLDDFKKFNDTYGHIEGDQVLMRLGQVVKRCLRQTDSAYRYGGEEFTILLPMTTGADAAVTAERIKKEFKKETFTPVSGKDVHMTVSIGLAQYKPPEDMKAFVHRVDQLMYKAKKDGKDRVRSES